MDISKEYVELCERAYKIQRQWHPEIGDIVGGFDSGRTTIISGLFGSESLRFLAGGSVSHQTTVVWLPRQDQLQDMINETWTSVDLAWHFSEWATKATNEWGNPTPFGSMERLWLAYVMAQKYCERWNNKEWIGD